MEEVKKTEIGIAGGYPPPSCYYFFLCKELGNVMDGKFYYGEYGPFVDDSTEDNICFKDFDDKVVFLVKITKDLKMAELNTKKYRHMGIFGEIFVFHCVENVWYNADINGNLTLGGYSHFVGNNLKEYTDRIQTMWEIYIKKSVEHKKKN